MWLFFNLFTGYCDLLTIGYLPAIRYFLTIRPQPLVSKILDQNDHELRFVGHGV